MESRLSLLGGTELTGIDGRSITSVLRQPKRLALLSYLTIARPHGFQRRDRVLFMFWPDKSDERARATLRKSTYMLRRSLGTDVIVSRGDDEIGVDPERLWCDVRELDRALQENRPEDALALYRGDLLDGFYLDGATPEFEQWLDEERTRLKKLVSDATWDLSAARELEGDMRSAAKLARRAFDLAPPDGERFRRLLEVLDAAGDRAGALQSYEKYAAWLADEYEADPPPETVQLIEKIRSRSEAIAVAPTPSKTPGAGALAREAVAVTPAPSEVPGAVAGAGEHPEPAPVSALPRSTRWRRAGVLAACLVAASLIPTTLALRNSSSPDLDPNLLAVAPFSVFSPEHRVWSEGIGDYLSRSLDRAGELRTIAPTAAVRAWPGRADVESAEIAGRRTGAGLVLFGSLMGIGDDSVRVNATLVDVAEVAVLGDLEIRGTPERMDQLVDSLTVEVLRELSETRQIGAMRYTSIGSRSMPAPKAFLAGEQAFRRTAWDTARAEYARAVELDSTFAMAHLRLGNTIRFITVGGSDEAWQHVARAGTLNQGLSHHDSLLVSVAADVAAGRLGPLPEGGYPELAVRAYQGALEAIREYPDDAEAWYMVGLVRNVFYDQLHNVDLALIADAIDRSIALDSAFAPAYPLAFRYALDESRIDNAREYARKYLSLNPPEPSGEIPLLLDRLLDPWAEESEVDSLLGTVHPETLYRTWFSTWLLTDSTELAIRVARESAGREHDPRYGVTAPHMVNRNLAAVLAYRGYVRESAEVGGLEHQEWFQAQVPEMAMLGMIPPEVADSTFREWLDREDFSANVMSHALWWWASRSDTAAVLRYLARGGHEPVGKAAMALARGDTAETVLRLDSVETGWVHTNLTVLTRARLLRAVGRDEEALEVLRSRFLNDWPLASRVLWVLERARLADRLGHEESALRDYLFVTRVWARADPELQPLVREAEAALARLGDRRR